MSGPAVVGGEVDVNRSLFGRGVDDQSPLFTGRSGVRGHPVIGGC